MAEDPRPRIPLVWPTIKDKPTYGYLVELRRSIMDALEILVQAIIAGEGGDVVAALQFARVRRGSATSVANSTQTAISFDTTVFNNAGTAMFNPATPTRLIAPSAGIYVAFGQVWWAFDATGSRQIAIRLNGTTIIAQLSVPGNVGVDSLIFVATPYVLNTGEYVELTVLQDSGGNLDVNGSDARSPVLSLLSVGTF